MVVGRPLRSVRVVSRKRPPRGNTFGPIGGAISALLVGVAAEFSGTVGSGGGSGADGGRTFYIDFVGGSDSNNGTSTATPWKRHPFMQGWAGSYTHQTGDNFIFKGGVTWPALCFTLNAYLGNGASGNVDYYGADTSWFTGAAFTRPVFDGEYTVDTLVYFLNSSYVTFDNIELKRVSASFPYTYGMFVGDGSGTNNHHLTIQDCYLHGWRTTASTDDAHGGIIFTSFGSQVETIVIDGCEISNQENVGGSQGAGPNGVMCRMVGVIRNSYLHHNSSAVLFCVDFDNNVLEDVNGPTASGWLGGDYHPNGVYLDAQTLGKTVAYIRNSTFIGARGGANMAYLNGRNATLHCYNNVFYGGATGQGMIEVEPYAYGDTTDSGTYNIYNNTAYIQDSDPCRSLIRGVDRGGAPAANVINARNNHVIGTSVSLISGGGWNTLNQSNNLIQTLATANAQGYTQANEFAPTSGSGGTVNAGTDPGTIFTTDKNGVTRTTWDIGAYEWAA